MLTSPARDPWEQETESFCGGLEHVAAVPASTVRGEWRECRREA
jgi:hypothetical protein